MADDTGQSSQEPDDTSAPPDAGEAEWLDARAAADFLGISEGRLQRLRRRGEIDGTRIGWRRWRFRVSDLMAYVRKSADRMTPATLTPEPPPDAGAAPPDAEPGARETTRYADTINKAIAEFGPPGKPSQDGPAFLGKPIVQMANVILSDAIRFGASEVHLQGTYLNVIVRVRIDGLLYEWMAIPPHFRLPLFQRFKVMADLDPFAKGPQAGSISIKHEEQNSDVQTVSAPSPPHAENLTLRFFYSSQLPWQAALGMADETRAWWQWCVAAQRSGLVLLCGPHYNGATTTAYSTLNRLNAIERKIVTVEDLRTYSLAGVLQIRLAETKGLTWRTATAAALRQGADVLFLGDLDGPEAAEAAVAAAESGVFTLATLPAASRETALRRLSAWGFDRARLGDTLSAVLYQRLARRVCPDCQTEYEGEDPETKEAITLRRGTGCDSCRKTGYKGRVGVFEFARYPDGATGDPHVPVIFRDDLYRKVRDGVTTVDEAERLLQ